MRDRLARDVYTLTEQDAVERACTAALQQMPPAAAAALPPNQPVAQLTPRSGAYLAVRPLDLVSGGGAGGSGGGMSRASSGGAGMGSSLLQVVQLLDYRPCGTSTVVTLDKQTAHLLDLGPVRGPDDQGLRGAGMLLAAPGAPYYVISPPYDHRFTPGGSGGGAAMARQSSGALPPPMLHHGHHASSDMGPMHHVGSYGCDMAVHVGSVGDGSMADDMGDEMGGEAGMMVGSLGTVGSSRSRMRVARGSNGGPMRQPYIKAELPSSLPGPGMVPWQSGEGPEDGSVHGTTGAFMGAMGPARPGAGFVLWDRFVHSGHRVKVLQLWWLYARLRRGWLVTVEAFVRVVCLAPRLLLVKMGAEPAQTNSSKC